MASLPLEKSYADMDTSILLQRHKVEKAYQSLRDSSLKDENSCMPAWNIDIYEQDVPGDEEFTAFLDQVLSMQSELVRVQCSSLHSAKLMQKRREVVKRMLLSISIEHKSCKGSVSSRKSKSSLRGDGGLANTDLLNPQADSSTDKCTDALLEISVRTGLTLLFSLLQQCWREESSGLRAVCDSVLITVGDVLLTLPPLSLANTSKLPKIGVESISLIQDFLKKTISTTIDVDEKCRQLAASVLLGFYMQQGSLGGLLDWIEMCIVSGLNQNSLLKLDGESFWKFRQSIRPAKFVPAHDTLTNTWRDERTLSLPMAGLLLLKEIADVSQFYAQNSPHSSKLGDDDTVVMAAYVWGSNSSHQLTSDNDAKILLPKQNDVFANALEIESGLYCTFVITSDNNLYACGKSSHGRLGLGDSAPQDTLQKVVFPEDKNIVKISSSKSSNGHTLALCSDGIVYSWGDGDYGKLGHGTFVTQRSPKIIQGQLRNKAIKSISAGNRHSAVALDTGEVYTWGEGEHGRLGHGDNETKTVPTLVHSLKGVVQVCCGASHTIALSEDGTTVWSFGAGDAGKLGHGDVNRIHSPKVVAALNGIQIIKVAASAQSSAALSTDGHLYVWGSGPCLGGGSVDAVYLVPQLLETLKESFIIDISMGDTHCLALTKQNEVYSWGNNSMGQCGLGHCVTPITSPHKVPYMGNIKVQQVSAGTSHSVVWTCPPKNRNLVTLQRPYALSVNNVIFTKLRKLINYYIEHQEELSSLEYCPSFSDQYFKSVLKLLDSHLSHLPHTDHYADILGNESKLLLELLFKLIHKPLPDELHLEVASILSTSSKLLLPPLSERIELLYSLLPQRIENLQDMSKGQSLQLTVVLKSFQSHDLVGDIFGCIRRLDNISMLRDHSREKHTEYMRMCSQQEELKIKLAAILLKLLFKNHCLFLDILFQSVLAETKVTTYDRLPMQSSLKSLLIMMQNHLYACMCYGTTDKIAICSNTFKLYVDLLLSYCKELFLRAICFLKTSKDAAQEKARHECLIDYLEKTGLAEMLLITVDTLSFLPMHHAVESLKNLLWLLMLVDKINRHAFAATDAASRHYAYGAVPDRSWTLDLELALSYLVGKTLRTMMHGSDLFEEEKRCKNWLESNLLESELEGDRAEMENSMKKQLEVYSDYTLEACPATNSVVFPSSAKNLEVLHDFATNCNASYGSAFWHDVYDYALSKDLLMYGEAPPLLVLLTMRHVFAAIIKRCRLELSEDGSLPWKVTQQLCDKAFPILEDLQKMQIEGSNETLVHSCKVLLYHCGILLIMIKPSASETCDNIDKKAGEICQFLLQTVRSKALHRRGASTSPWNDSIHTTIISALKQQNVRALNKIESLKVLVSFFNGTCSDSNIVPFMEMKSTVDSLVSDGQLFLLIGLLVRENKEEHHTHSQIKHLALGKTLQSIMVDLLSSFWTTILQWMHSQDDSCLLRQTLALMKALIVSEVVASFDHAAPLSGRFPLSSPEFWRHLDKIWDVPASESSLKSFCHRLAANVFLNVLLITSEKANVLGSISLETPVKYAKRQLQDLSENCTEDNSSALRDLLVVLKRCCLQSKVVSVSLGSLDVVNCLMKLAESPLHSCANRMIALRLLFCLLEHAVFTEIEMSEIIERIFSAVWLVFYCEPQNKDSVEYKRAADSLLNKPQLIPVSFDPTRSDSEIILSGRSAMRSSPDGKYALANHPMKKGRFMWKFLIVRKGAAEEGLCIGVSKFPLANDDYSSTSDVWGYQSSNGMLLHNGLFRSGAMPYTQGDFITCLMDMDTGTLSFGKNSEDVVVAFSNITAETLYPCVLFYGSAVKLQVTITDFKKLSDVSLPCAGVPVLCDFNTTVVEELVCLARKLHATLSWKGAVEKCIMSSMKTGNVDSQRKQGYQEVSYYSRVLPAVWFYSGVDQGVKIGSKVAVERNCVGTVLQALDSKGSKLLVHSKDSSEMQKEIRSANIQATHSHGRELDVSVDLLLFSLQTLASIAGWDASTCNPETNGGNALLLLLQCFLEFSAMKGLHCLLQTTTFTKNLVNYCRNEDITVGSVHSSGQLFLEFLSNVMPRLVAESNLTSSLARNYTPTAIQRLFNVLIGSEYSHLVATAVKAEGCPDISKANDAVTDKHAKDNTGETVLKPKEWNSANVQEELLRLGFQAKDIERATAALPLPPDSDDISQYYSDMVDWLLLHLYNDPTPSSDDSDEGSDNNTAATGASGGQLFSTASAILQRFHWMADHFLDEGSEDETLATPSWNLPSITSFNAGSNPYENSLIECELCNSAVEKLFTHMIAQHPGCGGHNNDHGYRSTGEYITRLFRGRCGTGSSYYLLCTSCRQQYLDKLHLKLDHPANRLSIDAETIENAPDLLMDRVKSHGDEVLPHGSGEAENAFGANRPIKCIGVPKRFSKIQCLGEVKQRDKYADKSNGRLGQQVLALTCVNSRKIAAEHALASSSCLFAKKVLLMLTRILQCTLSEELYAAMLVKLGLSSVDIGINLLGSIVTDHVLAWSDTSRFAETDESIERHLNSVLCGLIKTQVLHEPSAAVGVVKMYSNTLAGHAAGSADIGSLSPKQGRPLLVTPLQLLKAKLVIQEVVNSGIMTKMECKAMARECLMSIADGLSACITLCKPAHMCQEWASLLLVTMLNQLKQCTASPVMSIGVIGSLCEVQLKKETIDTDGQVVLSSASGLQSKFAMSFADGLVTISSILDGNLSMPEWSHKQLKPVKSLAFNSTSTLLAGVSESHIIIWEVAAVATNGLEVDVGGEITAMCWSNASGDGDPSTSDALLVGRQDGATVVLHIDVISFTCTLEKQEAIRRCSPVSCVAWGCHDNHFVVGHCDGVASFKAETKTLEPTTLDIHEGVVRRLEVSPGCCSLIASLGDDNKAKLFYNGREGVSLIRTFSLDDGMITCLCWGNMKHEGCQLALGTSVGTVYTWEVHTKSRTGIVRKSEDFLTVSSHSSSESRRSSECDHVENVPWDGIMVTIGSQTSECKTHIQDITALRIHHYHTAQVVYIELNPTGEILMSCCKAGIVNVVSMKGVLLATMAIESVPERIHWMEDIGLVITSLEINHALVFKLKVADLLASEYLAYCREQLALVGVTDQKIGRHLAVFLQSGLITALEMQYRHEESSINCGSALGVSEYLTSLASIAIFFSMDKILQSTATRSISWVKKLTMANDVAAALTSRHPFPKHFNATVKQDVEYGNEEAFLAALDNSKWSVEMDADIITWNDNHPNDWQPDTSSCVYVWGSGSSGQLAELGDGVQATPQHLESAGHACDVICGQNCTFVLHFDGSVMASGDGSYGRLGLGNSDNINMFSPLTSLRGYVVTQLATSHGSYGHSLALTDTGEVFSWGDGEYGKLGHGSGERERLPRQIKALKDTPVVQVACGLKHSAVVTCYGQLLTFGNGEHGCLGHGNETHQKVPTEVTALKCHEIGQISCGLNHSMAVSADGNTVWGFGCAEFGKLGDGGLRSSNVPVVVKELQGMKVKKIGCGIQFTVALLEEGRIYTCGNDRYLGHAVPRHDLYPSLVERLSDVVMTDISVGAEYSLALDSSGNVWTWGHNNKHQLGRDSNASNLLPEIVPHLIGKGIKNISAGRSHSAAWSGTCFPPRQPGTYATVHHGVPPAVRPQYTSLEGVDLEAIRWRLRVLVIFSQLLYGLWNFINIKAMTDKHAHRMLFEGIYNGQLRPLFTSRLRILPLIKAIDNTMENGREVSIAVNRFGTGNEKPAPILTQIAEQVLQQDPKQLCHQSRAWKIRLVDEAADDAGGVFDDTMTEMCQELQRGDVRLLVPTANNLNQIGFNQDRFLPNHELRSKDDLGLFRFLGILIGVSLRTRRPINLPLAPIVWKQLLAIPVCQADLEEVDVYLIQSLKAICTIDEAGITPETFSEMIPSTLLSDTDDPYQCLVELSYSNRHDYAQHVIESRLIRSSKQLAAIRSGLSTIVPMEVLSLLTPRHLEELVCGSSIVDIASLQKLTRYREISVTDDVIVWLWEILHAMGSEERALFLRFVSGRSCLPKNTADVSQRLQIVGCKGISDALPTAQTCFFVLKLPKYTSKAMLAEKLSYAIHNCRAIDTDYYVLLGPGQEHQQ